MMDTDKFTTTKREIMQVIMESMTIPEQRAMHNGFEVDVTLEQLSCAIDTLQLRAQCYEHK